MTTQSASRYVARHPGILQGEPIIAGTRTSVRAIVELWRLGITPEEIPINQEEINTYIERNRIPEELIHPAVKAAMKKP
ncbi:MAG: DUF433 domain-containing protein [Oscillatoriales cyanobacterium]|nr:MAG: DUF433 domain-containing protein [Oscillatoriales cyanobacterium]